MRPITSLAAYAALLATLAGFAPSSSAQTNLIVNGGFESLTNPPALTTTADGDYYRLEPDGTWLDGWNAVLVSGTTGLGVVPAIYRGISAASGAHYLIFETSGIQLTQTISLEGGTSYVFSFDAARETASATSFTLGLTDGSDAILNETFSVTTGAGVWDTYTYEFTAANTADYTLSFQRISRRAAIDNVSLTAVPEPAMYAALLGAGALGFAVWRRRGGRQSV